MQLPTAGHPLHTRSLTLAVTRCRDGRWLAHGEVLDLRKCGFVPMSADIQPAGIIHHMMIDLEIAPADLRVESIAVAQPHVAVEPSEDSRGECCRDPAVRLQKLRGERLDRGFGRALATTFGGPRGCSHLLTLFQLMATGIARAHSLEAAAQMPRGPDEIFFRRSVFVDGHELPDRSIGIAIQLADFWTNPPSAGAGPLRRLAGQWDVRAHARVEHETRLLRDLVLATRHRTHANLDCEWQIGSARLAFLEGTPIFPGLGRRLFGGFDEANDRLILDSLLQFAPGYVQILAAVIDRWLERAASGGQAAEDAGVADMGGLPDSCYMWRSDGPLATPRKPNTD